MNFEQFAALLGAIPEISGKVAMSAFPDGEAPNLPFVVYRQTGSNNLAADNHVYFSRPIVEIELYTEIKSPDTEAALESALASAELIWTKDEDYLDSERCYMITYTVTF